jgi:putative transport protein
MAPMKWLFDMLRQYPEIAIFLTLALGFWVGQMRLGKFSLGVVTSTLLAGVLIGQLGITISPNVKSVFFLMFLFAVGYGVGPQFFRGLKSDGLQQVLFSAILCVLCLLSTFLVAKAMGYHTGLAAGLLSGACTISAVLGVATDTINQLGVSAEQKKAWIDAMPVAYAVTYLFGTAGSAWILGTLGPKLLRVDLPAECKKLEASMGASEAEPGVISAYQRFVVRAYRLIDSRFIGKTVDEFEHGFPEKRLFILRIQRGDEAFDAQPSTVLQKDMIVAVAGRREWVLDAVGAIGVEVDEPELLDVTAQILDVVVTNKALAGKTLLELAQADTHREFRGIFLRKLIRAGREMPFTPGTKIDRGDVLQLAGPKSAVDRAAQQIGYADRITEKTDMLFMGLGIVIGALIGALSIHVGGVPLSLSTSGGALIAGLVCGWLRSVNATFGRIPAPALWVFNNVGLNTFIAVVGISAGPGFVAGLQANGLGLFVSGIVVTTIPFIVMIFVGKYLFKMHPGIVLGACAGARTTTAALGAIEEAAKSKVPALGYTVTYAVGNTLLIIWGVAIVLMTT